MSSSNRARTTEEMRFAAALPPCAACGARVLGGLELRGEGSHWTYQGACTACGATRTFEFTTAGDPRVTRAGRFDLGPGISSVITPEQFLAVLDETSPKVSDSPASLSPAARRAAMADLTRAMTSVSELLKLVSAGAKATDPRFELTWLEGQYKRLHGLVGAYRPTSTISQAALDGHLAWLKRGGKGDGHLEIIDRSLADEFYGGVDLTFATFTNVDFTNVELAYCILDEADLENCRLDGAVLEGASITNAHITGGDWSKVRLATAKLTAAAIDGTTFAKADLERSTWDNAKVVRATFDGARFGNATFDGATFDGCSFRAATFQRTLPEPAPTSRGAVFTDCDFAGCSLTDRDLRGTTFVRCKLASTQPPVASAVEGLVLTDCDVNVERFLAPTN